MLSLYTFAPSTLNHNEIVTCVSPIMDGNALFSIFGIDHFLIYILGY